MIDRLPEDKMIFVVNILENIGEISGISLHLESIPNETVPEESIDNILEHLTGIIPDTGKTLKEYQEERRQEHYGITHIRTRRDKS